MHPDGARVSSQLPKLPNKKGSHSRRTERKYFVEHHVLNRCYGQAMFRPDCFSPEIELHPISASWDRTTKAYRIGEDQSGGNGTILQPVRRRGWPMSSRRPEIGRGKRVAITRSTFDLACGPVIVPSQFLQRDLDVEVISLHCELQACFRLGSVFLCCEHDCRSTVFATPSNSADEFRSRNAGRFCEFPRRFRKRSRLACSEKQLRLCIKACHSASCGRAFRSKLRNRPAVNRAASWRRENAKTAAIPIS
jgi:hypothetical protein